MTQLVLESGLEPQRNNSVSFSPISTEENLSPYICLFGKLSLVTPTYKYMLSLSDSGMDGKEILLIDFLFPRDQFRCKVNSVFVTPSLWTLHPFLGLTPSSHHIFFGYIPKSIMQDHIAVLFFHILWNTILTLIVTGPLLLPISSAQGFTFLHIITNNIYLLFFIRAIPKDVKWYLIVILICIYLTVGKVEIFSCSYCHMYVIFWNMSIQIFSN